MTAKKQAPLEPVQWVLNFLNLGCIPGEPNPWRLPDEKRKLKRPPLFNKRYIRQTLSSLETIEIKEERRSLSLIVGKDKRYVWGLNDKGEYLFDGRNSVPTTEDFRDFFLKYGIPPIKGEDITLYGNIKIKDWKTIKPPADRDSQEFRMFMYEPPLEVEARTQIIEIWKRLSDLFLGMAWAPDAEKRKSEYQHFKSFIEHILKLYRECLEEDEIPAKDYKSSRGFEGWGIYTIITKGLSSIEPFFHYGDLPQALYAIILDFANHFKELHGYLRQCSLCGNFFVPVNKGRGRPNILYCSPICEHKVNNTPTRYDDLMNKRLARTKKRNNDKPKIIKHLMNHYFFQGKNGRWDYPNTKEANIIYNKLPKRITANYDYFIKKWAEPGGYT